ncbi:MAG: TRAP transporter permease [Synergistota bacterium]|nr:TRAP transporter permease [Synergistota bacterium]
MRNLKVNWQNKLIIVMCITISLFQLYTAALGMLEGRLQRGIHLAFLLPMVFLLYPMTQKSDKDKFNVMDSILAVLSIIPSIYLVLNNTRITQRWEQVTPLLSSEIILGALIILIIIEALRRAVAPALAWVVIISLIYAKAGPWLPGMFHHQGVSWTTLIERLYLLSDDGIYGYLLGISATYIYIFVLFGAFVLYSGAGDFFTNFATSICGKYRGGPGIVAVTSCCFFGMLSGSSVANVFATGSFTVPLMKKAGYDADFSGAVVAAASTGGMYMPPVMGAAAFIMAEILGISYVKVALSASISAILYYIALGLMVYFRARRENIMGMDKKDIPLFKDVVKQFYLLIPIIALFYLLVKGYSPVFAGIVSIAVTVVITWVKPAQGMRPRQIMQALIDGGKNCILVAVACAGTGIVVSVVTQTGLGLSFSNVLVRIAGGNVIIAMLLICAAALVIGHGAPTSATYILVATVGAGALIRMGVNPIAAHLFCLYFAVIADITPPVAVAAYAGASVAGGNPIATGFKAFALAFAGFIVPMVFVLNPALVLQGSVVDCIWGTITCLIGIIGMSGALQGWFLNNLSMPKRYILALSGLALLFPGLLSDFAGFVILSGMAFYELSTRKKVAMDS